MPSTPDKHSYSRSPLSVALSSVVSTGESGYANQDGEDEELNLAGENCKRAERRACTQVQPRGVKCIKELFNPFYSDLLIPLAMWPKLFPWDGVKLFSFWNRIFNAKVNGTS